MNPNNFKLIAFDLDGTLLNSDKQISAYSKNVVKRLSAKGIHCTIATGRILPDVKHHADELEIDIPLIMSNGSILQTRQGDLTSQTCLPDDAVKTAIELSKNSDCDLILYIGDTMFFLQLTESIQLTYGNELRPGMKELKSWDAISDQTDNVNKCIFTHVDNDQLVHMQSILKEKLNGNATTLRSSPILLEIQPNNITKAKGLCTLADMLGVQMEQTIAFGDYDNDAEMLAAAGLGIAVGEASPKCLANADLVVAPPDDDGPAHFLEEFFLSN
jgi:hypothetical protein